MKSHADIVYDLGGTRSNSQAAKKLVTLRLVEKFDGGLLRFDDAPVVIRDRFDFIDDSFNWFIILVCIHLRKTNRSNEWICVDRFRNNMHIKRCWFIQNILD